MKLLRHLLHVSEYRWTWAQSRYYSKNVLKLSERGMFQDMFPNTAGSNIKYLLTTSPQCVYAGFDPTASSLHVGNLLVIVNLLHWQRAGHQVIALLGGATGQIGDPSGRSTDRVAMKKDTLQQNIMSIKKNLETVFENHEKYLYTEKNEKLKPVKIVNNETWYREINSIDFISDIGRNFRMGTMLLKQNVQSKLNSDVGMSFTEFAYQIFQSYDWLHLLKEYNCRFQIGGSDQMGNITAGHELISRVAKQEVFGLTLPLVTTEEGDKFGKSAGNALWLDADKTSPFALYQYFMRTKDADAERLLKLFTFLTLGEVKDLMLRHARSPEKRVPQTALAEQLTLLVHGESGLAAARRASSALFGGDAAALGALSPREVRDVFAGAPVTSLLLAPGVTVLQLAMKAGCFPTEADAMRIISAGGFYVNQTRCRLLDEVITESAHILPNLVSVLRVGKRNYTIVQWRT